MRKIGVDHNSRGDYDAHSVTNFKRSTRGPQSGQNCQSLDFSAHNSFNARYSLITSQTYNGQVHQTTGDRGDIVGTVNYLRA